MIVMAMQEKMRGCFCLQTTSTQRVNTVLKVMIKSVFIKMTFKPSLSLVSSFSPIGLQML